MRSAVPKGLALAAACLLAAVGITRASSHGNASARTSPPKPPLVTPVEGPSNFHRLDIDFESSNMGQTGVWGPPPESYAGPPVNFVPPVGIARTLALSGSDLYRLECRPCHKAEGGGAPPEIPSVFGPVQATSASLMEARMKERGRPITPAFARELASGSEKDLLDRLKNGGQKMPAFGYLSDGEIRALIGYLDGLSGVPVSGKPPNVNEPAMRVGELLVKGTCHICHDAAGSWPDPNELLEGSIPPIAGFIAKKTMPEFMWKVRHGAPVVMGSLAIPSRGRMPVFDYLTDDEVASAYLYLINDPPRNPGGLQRPRN